MRENPLRLKEISRLVARQLGHITRLQLLRAGLNPAWIERHVASGELIPVHAGVYAVGHIPVHAHARAWAAILACGPDAVLSHAAAAALWKVAEWPATLEVTAPAEHRRPGIHTHRSGTLGSSEVRTHQGIRLTAPVRTVIDLQPRLSDARLCRTIDDLRVVGHLRSAGFSELCARSSRVMRLLGDVEGFSRSELEDRFRAFLVEYGLPLPEFNVRLPGNGREVDALYRAERLIIELDSWSRHSARTSFERDREIDEWATDSEYSTVRVTHLRLTDPDKATLLAARITRILARAHQS